MGYPPDIGDVTGISVMRISERQWTNISGSILCPIATSSARTTRTATLKVVVFRI